LLRTTLTETELQAAKGANILLCFIKRQSSISKTILTKKHPFCQQIKKRTFKPFFHLPSTIRRDTQKAENKHPLCQGFERCF
jgi:hypothetical protein